MERHWPSQVPDKERLLSKSRRHLARYLIHNATFAETREAQEILRILPQYGRFPRLLPQVWLIQHGGGELLRSVYRIKLRLRQLGKKMLYKDNDNPPFSETVTGKSQCHDPVSDLRQRS